MVVPLRVWFSPINRSTIYAQKKILFFYSLILSTNQIYLNWQQQKKKQPRHQKSKRRRRSLSILFVWLIFFFFGSWFSYFYLRTTHIIIFVVLICSFSTYMCLCHSFINSLLQATNRIITNKNQQHSDHPTKEKSSAVVLFFKA